MAEGLGLNGESKGSEDRNREVLGNGSQDALFHRRIQFHHAKKPFVGLGNGGGGGDGGGFRLETLNPGLNNQRSGVMNQCQAGMIVKKVESSEFLENGLDPELSFGITVRRIGAGLQNLGNTCFLNSVLQCLTYTEPLAAYLQSGKHQNSCHIAGFCALCAIQKHVSRALQSTGRILAPNDLVSNLRCISRNFRNSRQEDAHEYMVNLLESMHKCCLPSGVPSESPSAYEKSLVHKIFGGRLRSQVKCMQCSYSSNTFDPFLDLSLEIAKAESLQRALVNFTAAEQLDGGAKLYHCQRCKQKVRALKQLTVHKAPYVLTIHLKRFRAHDPGQKIDKKVHFGPTLDLKPFVSGSYDGDLKYTLYGVLVHLGWTTRSGHYYCFVRTSSGMWYSLDDNRVIQVSEKTVLEQKAYMLFYGRDRKSVPLKKSVDVGQIENTKANINGKGPCFNFNQVLKKPHQNGQIEKRLSNGASPAAVIVPNDGLSKETKEASVKSNNASIDCSVTKRAHESKPSGELSMSKAPVLGPSSEIQLSNEPPKELFVLSSNLGELSSPSAPSVNANSKNANANLVSINICSKKDTNNLDAPSNCNKLQGSDNKNIAMSEASQKINLDLKEGISTVRPCSIPSDETLETIDPIGIMPCKNVACDLLEKKAGDVVQKAVPDDSVEVSNLSIVTKSSQKTSLDSAIHKKSRKKLLKSQFSNVHLGPNILFRVSLGIQKKKKHKRSKCHSLGKKKHLLDEDHILSDVGPSTSEEAGQISIGSTHSRKKCSKSCSRKGANVIATRAELNDNDDPVRDATRTEFKERIDQNEAVLATNTQLQKTSSSIASANQSDASESDSLKDKKRDVMQNGSMNLLTRGMDQSIVARWDGIELHPAQIMESNCMDSVSIGYVPDEWDEEYDRGKRRKVRQTKHDFGGSNPFQEVATKKAQWKNAKMDHHSSSGNRPFRI